MNEANDQIVLDEAAANNNKDSTQPERNLQNSAGSSGPVKKSRPQRCRFFASRKGCRDRDECPFFHDVTRLAADDVRRVQRHVDAHSGEDAVLERTVKAAESSNGASHLPTPQAHRQGLAFKDAGRSRSQDVVPKPQSKAATQDPRTFQIKQIKTRFNATEDKAHEGGTTLSFVMPPSDPDFPFEIDSLKCTIKIPPAFLWAKRPPSLKVSNKELERGYQVNVEKGFDAIWSSAANPTLLGVMKALDKNLEQILTAPKADIIKIIAPVVPIKPKDEPDLPLEPSFAAGMATASSQSTQAKPVKLKYTPAQMEEASRRREIEVRILENRLGRDPHFAKIADGTAFDLPVEPRKRDALSAELRAIKAVRLYVPLSYPLEECAIEALGVESGTAAVNNLENNFRNRAKQNSAQSLLSHVNFLVANMHNMTNAPTEAAEAANASIATLVSSGLVVQEKNHPLAMQLRDTDKAHMKIVTRPVEWSIDPVNANQDADSSDMSSDYDDSDFSEEDDEAGESDGEQAEALDTRSRGVLLSFPHLELFHIALLELHSVHLVVKCERCKDTTSLANISNNVFAEPPATRTERCKKCQAPFSVGFRRDIMHASSIRAGYLDLEGATPFDLLPSPFVPTCSACMTAHPPVTGVRGDAALAICRECHAKMTFRIPESKFLRLGPSMPLNIGSLPMKRPKENLGITAGTELPRTGRCRHYAKSHRWFRFSCCNRVYPCDKCHDDVEKDHVQEFANRIICGYCSREQNYRPEDCSFCRKSLVGRRGRGFWEGGKGTRDPKRMSRKDPRKYKRRGKGAAEKAKKEK